MLKYKMMKYMRGTLPQVLIAKITRFSDGSGRKAALLENTHLSSMAARVVSEGSNSTVFDDILTMALVPSLVSIVLLYYQVLRVAAAGIVTQVTHVKLAACCCDPGQLVQAVVCNDGEVVEVHLLDTDVLGRIDLGLGVEKVDSLVSAVVSQFAVSTDPAA